MKKGVIELTEQEANTLLELINIASKATGLQTVDVCKHFKDKITASFEDKKEIEETKTEQ